MPLLNENEIDQILYGSPQEREGSFFGDTASALSSGLGVASQTYHGLAGMGTQGADRAYHGRQAYAGAQADADAQGNLSSAAQRGMQAGFLPGGDGPSLLGGDVNPIEFLYGMYLKAVQSMPGMAATVAGGAAASIATGNPLPAMAVGAASEGLQGAGQSFADAMTRVYAMPAQELQKTSPAYVQALLLGKSEGEARDAAVAALSALPATGAGVASGVLGTVTGRLGGGMASELGEFAGKSLMKRMGVAGAEEGLTESAQSMIQEAATQDTVRKWSPRDVLEAGAQGGMIGFGMGGPLGGFQGKGKGLEANIAGPGADASIKAAVDDNPVPNRRKPGDPAFTAMQGPPTGPGAMQGPETGPGAVQGPDGRPPMLALPPPSDAIPLGDRSGLSPDSGIQMPDQSGGPQLALPAPEGSQQMPGGVVFTPAEVEARTTELPGGIKFVANEATKDGPTGTETSPAIAPGSPPAVAQPAVAVEAPAPKKGKKLSAKAKKEAQAAQAQAQVQAPAETSPANMVSAPEAAVPQLEPAPQPATQTVAPEAAPVKSKALKGKKGKQAEVTPEVTPEVQPEMAANFQAASELPSVEAVPPTVAPPLAADAPMPAKGKKLKGKAPVTPEVTETPAPAAPATPMTSAERIEAAKARMAQEEAGGKPALATKASEQAPAKLDAFSSTVARRATKRLQESNGRLKELHPQTVREFLGRAEAAMREDGLDPKRASADTHAQYLSEAMEQASSEPGVNVRADLGDGMRVHPISRVFGKNVLRKQPGTDRAAVPREVDQQVSREVGEAATRAPTRPTGAGSAPNLHATRQMPEHLTSLASDIIKDFGVTEPVFLIHPNDVAELNRPELDELREMLRTEANGVALKLENGSAVVMVTTNASPRQQTAILAHEMTHVLMHTVMRDVQTTNPELWSQIQDRAEAWYEANRNKPLRDALRDRQPEMPVPENYNATVDEHYRGFGDDGDWARSPEEYLADQFARLVMEPKRVDPANLPLLERMADVVRQMMEWLWRKATGAAPDVLPPDEAVAELMRRYVKAEQTNEPMDLDGLKLRPAKPNLGRRVNFQPRPGEAGANSARPFAQSFVDDLKKAATSRWEDVKDPVYREHLIGGAARSFLGALPFDSMVDWYRNVFTVAGKGNLLRAYGDVTQKISAAVRRHMDKAASVRRAWLAEAQQDPANHAKLEGVMYDATYWGVDPTRPLDDQYSENHLKKNPEIQDLHDDLRKRFDELPEWAQNRYRTTHEFFREQTRSVLRELMVKAINNQFKSRGEPAERAVMEQLAQTIMDASDKGLADAMLGEEMVGRLEPIRANLEQLADISRRKQPYFPLRRYGDYVLNYTYNDELKLTPEELKSYLKSNPAAKITSLGDNGDGTSSYEVELVHTEFLETAHDAAVRRKELQEETKGQGTLSDILRRDQWMENTSKQGNAPIIVETVVKQLQQEGASPAEVATMTQALYHAFNLLGPQKAFARSFARRRGVGGASADMMRALLTDGNAASWFLGRLRYGDDLDEAAFAIRDHAREMENRGGPDGAKARAVANEVFRRRERMTGTVETGRFEQVAGDLASFGALSGFAYPMVNALQMVTTGIPVLGGRFGYKRSFDHVAQVFQQITGSVLRSAAKQAKQVGTLKADDPMAAMHQDLMDAIAGSDLQDRDELRQLLMHLGDKGLIDQTMAIDVRHALNDKSANLMGNQWTRPGRVLRMVSDMTRIMPHATEVLNRAAVGIAAYQMAMQDGMSPEVATNHAEEAVRSSMFDYSSANRSRWVQQVPMGRLLFMFKHYGLSMYSLMVNNMRQALRGEGEEKAIARRTLLGIFAAHSALGGVLGGVFEPAKLAYGLVGMLAGGDNDEPWDMERDARRALADIVGPQLGEVIGRGLPRAVGVDLSSRISLSNLLAPRAMQGESTRANFAGWIAENTFGPSFSTLVLNPYDAYQIYAQTGDLPKAVERAAPALLRDVMQAGRLSQEGVTDRSGMQIAHELSPMETVLRLAGLQPGRVAETYEARSATQARKAFLTGRRENLLRQYADNPKERGNLRSDIQAFNKAAPDYKITADTIENSLTARKKRQGEVVRGASADKPSLRAASAFANLNQE